MVDSGAISHTPHMNTTKFINMYIVVWHQPASAVALHLPGVRKVVGSSPSRSGFFADHRIILNLIVNFQLLVKSYSILAIYDNLRAMARKFETTVKW